MVVLFNDLIDFLFNFFRFFCTAFELLGLIGGVWFMVYQLRLIIVSHRTADEAKESCRECSGYEICVAIMGNDLPGHACAYYKKKKP